MISDAPMVTNCVDFSSFNFQTGRESPPSFRTRQKCTMVNSVTTAIIATTIMRERYPERSNYIYRRPDVHIYVEDGRSFVRRSVDRYQVIQATLVDTWASPAAGAFALSENSLYTT